MCLGNIAKYFTTSSMKKIGSNEYVYDFSVDYNIIDTIDYNIIDTVIDTIIDTVDYNIIDMVINIHEYLMKKHEIKKCLE